MPAPWTSNTYYLCKYQQFSGSYTVGVDSFGMFYQTEPTSIRRQTANFPPSYQFKLTMWLVKIEPNSYQGDEQIQITLNGSPIGTIDFLSGVEAHECFDPAVKQADIFVKLVEIYVPLYTYVERFDLDMYVTPSFPTPVGQRWGIAGYRVDYLPCYGACSKCTSGFKDTCEDCILNAGLRYDAATTSCVCQFSNFYIDESDGFVCKQCSPICFTCSGPADNNCLTCDPDNNLVIDAATHTCKCAVGFYFPPPPTLKCEPCDPECLTCDGPLQFDCLTCDPARSYTFEPLNGTCTCPVGQYSERFGVPLDSQCSACDPACTSCRLLSTYCWSCAYGYYREDAEQRCTSCWPSCQTCRNAEENGCLTCWPHLVKNERGTNDITCECPNGQYMLNDHYTCLVCDANCLTCVGAGDYCTSCSSPSFLDLESAVTPQDHVCVQPCPVYYYGDTTDRTCKGCHSYCRRCTAPYNDQCSLCADNNYYQLNVATTCLPTCETNQFKQDADWTCRLCHSSCVTCTTQNTDTYCTSCLNGEYLDVLSMAPTARGRCQPCTAECRLCYGPADDECTDCSNNYYLQPDLHTCLNTCPNDYFPDNLDRRCYRCYSPCVTCNNGDSNQCLSCHNGYYLDSNQCLVCNAVCITCTGPDEDDCTSCKVGLYLLATSCVTQCPDGYYPSGAVCATCHATCASCTGGASTQCTS